MLTQDMILTIEKENINEFSKTLSKEDILQLVEWLALKDDKVRYQAFLILQSRSVFADDVYPHWGILCDKLKSSNSYQRSIGLMLLAENVRWDNENKFSTVLDDYLALLNDEKPITIRQCIQSLEKIIAAKPELSGRIIKRLIEFDFVSVRESMRKSIMLDILNVLSAVGKDNRTEEADSFIMNALSGEILDEKTKNKYIKVLM